MQDKVVPAKAGTHTPRHLQWVDSRHLPHPSKPVVIGPCFRRNDKYTSHRHFAVPHRRAGGQAFRRVDNGVGVDAVVAIELVDGAGLAEMLDAECFEPMAPYAAQPTERGGMAVDRGNYPAVSPQRRQHPFDMAEMRQATAGGGPAFGRGADRLPPG